MQTNGPNGLFLSIAHRRHLGSATVGILLGFQDIHGPMYSFYNNKGCHLNLETVITKSSV